MHNGIINNYQTLTDLLPAGTLHSETDSEVVVQLIGHLRPKFQSLFETFRHTLQLLEGTWAFVLTSVADPQTLFIARRGSPLIVGFSETNVFLGSERAAFNQFCRQSFVIPADTLLRIRCNEKKEFVISDGNQECLLAEYCPIEYHEDVKKPLTHSHAPYQTWTEKEICSQKDTVWDAMNRGARLNHGIRLGGLDKQLALLAKAKHLVLIASGTSLHACLFTERIFRGTRCFETVQSFDGSEFQMGDIPRDSSVVFVFVSQSGETFDCLRVLDKVQSIYPCIGVVNVVGSSIARKSHCGIYLNAGREVGVASTKSFTSQIVVLTLLALWFGKKSVQVQVWVDILQRLPTLLTSFIPKLRRIVKTLVPKIADQTSIMILGQHFAHAVSLEAALKIKELAYIHAEGYIGGALKHGTLALVQAGTPIFMHVFRGPNFKRMRSSCQEVLARGARVVVLTNQADFKQPKAEVVLFASGHDIRSLHFEHGLFSMGGLRVGCFQKTERGSAPQFGEMRDRGMISHKLAFPRRLVQPRSDRDSAGLTHVR